MAWEHLAVPWDDGDYFYLDYKGEEGSSTVFVLSDANEGLAERRKTIRIRCQYSDVSEEVIVKQKGTADGITLYDGDNKIYFDAATHIAIVFDSDVTEADWAVLNESNGTVVTPTALRVGAYKGISIPSKGVYSFYFDYSRGYKMIVMGVDESQIAPKVMVLNRGVLGYSKLG